MEPQLQPSLDLPYADETVRSRTGRGWEEWFAVLDAMDGTRLTHTEMTKGLAARHPEVGGWWIQGVVVGYERARGMRERHQTRGGYNASASRTIAVPVDRLFAAWAEPARRAEWLEEPLEVTTATPTRSVRVRCADGSRLEVLFTAKGEAKSQVSVEQTRLPDAEAVARRKAFWKERLDALSRLLAERPG